ncbi:AAA family ATPase [Oceanicella sp. SM1341]|uniref:bifunctional aminoglycoside phosphotransferase/ATP-binding protein n=1 Tax=Oceanicella sp. SM1341 TaxID=1548889 RepID=UPI000E5011DF|nr:AAA family ATPase [Oceanicella sp. SM1341]
MPPAEPEARDRAAQDRVIAFLSSPDAHGGAQAEHIETHLSHIFLAGDSAWKMKKAVRVGFADFSTAGKRRESCAAELELNRRTAPELYLDLVPVTEGPEGLRIGGEGVPVEHLVHMRRFPQDDLLDRVAARGALTEAHVRALADEISALHLSARRIPFAEMPERFATTLSDLTARLEAASEGRPAAAAVARWKDLIAPRGPALCARLDARARRGCVRACHGDLHLGNICLFEGRIRLFDGIEFHPGFSDIDILYDIAFTVMDLLHRGEAAFVPLLMSRYLAATRDYAALDLMAPLVSVRAAVRALVALMSPPSDETEARAGEYLGLAIAACAPTPRAEVIAVGGRSGTGKSTLAAGLARGMHGAVILRSDEIRKRLTGRAPEDRLGPEGYTPEAGAATYRRLFADADRALRAGASVLLDAAFLDPALRARAEALARARALPFTGFWLYADTDTLSRRLEARTADASDADTQVMRRQPADENVPGWRRLDADGGAAAVLSEARALRAEAAREMHHGK